MYISKLATNCQVNQFKLCLLITQFWISIDVVQDMMITTHLAITSIKTLQNNFLAQMGTLESINPRRLSSPWIWVEPILGKEKPAKAKQSKAKQIVGP
jgi:hypothetical protein